MDARITHGRPGQCFEVVFRPASPQTGMGVISMKLVEKAHLKTERRKAAMRSLPNAVRRQRHRRLQTREIDEPSRI